MTDIKKNKIGILGLGYVGLPLFIEFSKHMHVVGFDINKKRIEDLNNHYDTNLDITKSQLKNISNSIFTNKKDALSDCNIYIVTVPTPIDKNDKPNLSPLIDATKIVANLLKKNDVVIYESTVYPGATEEVACHCLKKFQT